jgi:putative endonuclease
VSDEARATGSFDAGQHTRARGNVGEDAAVEWLARAGFGIVERNARTPVGEIDVIAREGDVLCFVEVKARAAGTHGPAIGAVDRRKQRRLARCAGAYLATHDWRGPCRFDVLGLDGGATGWQFTLIRNAFEA